MGQIKPILPMMTPREAAAILAVGTEDSDAGTYLHRVTVSYRVGFSLIFFNSNRIWPGFTDFDPLLWEAELTILTPNTVGFSLPQSVS